MSYYGYQYKQQCYIPGGVKCPQPCPVPAALPCASCSPCSPCAPAGTKVYAVRKPLASPRCAGPCRPGCVETHVVEGHHHSSSSSSCSSSRCLDPCPGPFLQGREMCGSPCGSPCGPLVLRRCPQVCAPAAVCQDSSCPYSYQWSKSYQYNCGQ